MFIQYSELFKLYHALFPLTVNFEDTVAAAIKAGRLKVVQTKQGEVWLTTRDITVGR